LYTYKYKGKLVPTPGAWSEEARVLRAA